LRNAYVDRNSFSQWIGGGGILLTPLYFCRALKILGERATTGDKYDYILKQLYSPEPETRLKSLKVLIYLSTSGKPPSYDGG